MEDSDLYYNDLLITEVNLVDVSSGNYEIVNNFYKEFHINLNNLSEECYNDDVRNKYFKLLTLNKQSDLKLLSKGDDIMEDAVNKILSLSSDPNFISELERQQIQEYARSYALEKAEERGKESGINEGYANGKNDERIEIAKKMLEKNSDIGFISECTGMPIEQINKLRV